MNEEVVKNTKFCKINTKINNLENKIPDAYTLIQANQYNIAKQNLKQKMVMLTAKYQIKQQQKIISWLNKFLLHY